ncbi:MAG: 5-(carboxyamino)imidazole ribonucleotide synthase [Alphaproteobacteria bacterium]|nr:5-(carboxyamino)imidazole ribonucleotide synthase [Alphaproteobacteria bacterium]
MTAAQLTAAQSQGVLARPGDAIGLLGGGQLGRMLALAAADLGFDVHVFAPDKDCPASRVARKTWIAPYDDRAALLEFSASVKVVTIEFENIPVDAVDAIAAAGTPVRPDARSLAVSQDRLAEKSFLRDIGVEPAPFVRVDKADQIQAALDQLGGSGVLKTRFSGYDGKGQIRLSGQIQPAAAWAEMQGGRSILEAWIEHDREISVLLARGADGEVAAYDPPENVHSGGVLRRSTFPSTVPTALLAEATRLARRLAEELNYVGVLALELFVTKDGRLLANEFAPRVHNSGHWTQDACRTGQFEQHIRAVCGWPLGDPARHSDGEMINLLGTEIHDWPRHAADGAKVHLYGKRRTADGRKMGHLVRLRPKS